MLEAFFHSEPPKCFIFSSIERANHPFSGNNFRSVVWIGGILRAISLVEVEIKYDIMESKRRKAGR